MFQYEKLFRRNFNEPRSYRLKLKVIIILTLPYIACRFYFQHHVVSLFKLYGNNFKKLDWISDQKEVNGKNQRICGIPSSDYGIVFLRGAMLQWRHELNFLTPRYFLSAKRCFILQILIWMEYSYMSRLWCSLSMPYLTIYDNKSKSRERKEIKKFNKFDFQSEELTSFVYSSGWYEFESDACKKSIAFMIMKFQYPLKIKIFRIVKVHLKLFVVLG